MRETARVILVDDDTHVLLLQMEGPDAYDLIWFTPGGELECDESPRDAARRELEEETGLLVEASELGPPVAVSEGSFRWKGVPVAARDVFYIYRHPRFELDIGGHTGRERLHFRQTRWWSLEALASTTEQVFPACLGMLVQRFTTMARPPEPLVIPWTAK